MILSGDKIIDEVRNGQITIEPFNSDQVNPNSYNFRLGSVIVDHFAPAPARRRVVMDEDGLVLGAGRLYLGHTLERIGSTTYTPSLIGRSSIGRLGLFVQVDADLGQLGNAHRWTLELRPTIAVRVYPGMPFGQVSFWVVSGTPARLYTAGYSAFDDPTPSRVET